MTGAQVGVMAALASAAAFSQSVSGFGFSLLLVPPLSLAIGPKEAVVTATLLGLVTSAFTIATTAGAVDWRLAASLAASATVGIPVGLAILVRSNPAALEVGITLVVLLAVVATWRGVSYTAESRFTDVAAGVCSGVLSASAGMAGPPLVLHFHNRGIGRDSFKGTLNVLFFLSGTITGALFIWLGRVPGGDIAPLAVVAPLTAGAWVLGRRVRLDDARFRDLSMSILTISCLAALANIAGLGRLL